VLMDILSCFFLVDPYQFSALLDVN
jgi:hypothetical protein